MLPKYWDNDDSIEQPFNNRIGYYGAIQQIHATLIAYNHRREQSMCIQEFLSTELYTFNDSEMTKKLQQEETFNKKKQITLEALSTRSDLMENIISFNVFSQKNENLLQNVFNYSMNMERLIHLKHPPDTDMFMDMNLICLEEILKIDLFSLIGDIMFDENANIALENIEAIVCNLNTNLLHVITRNTCPNISICDKFNLSLDDELEGIRQMLIIGHNENSTLTDGDKTITSKRPFKIKRHDILNYVQQHNELIAYILCQMHDIEPLKPNDTSKIQLNYKLLNNIIQMDEPNVQMISNEGNDQMLAALNFDSFKLDLIRGFIEQKQYR